VHIQRQRKFRLLIYVFLCFIVSSCSLKNRKIIVEISKGFKIDNRSYIHSDESTFKINSENYSLRSRAIYDQKGHIDSLIVYKPEGTLQYSRSELLEDKNLVNYYNYPLSQNLIYKDCKILDTDKEILINKKFKNYLISQINTSTHIYKFREVTGSKK